jgi:polysaccharide biosynthesis transport protein
MADTSARAVRRLQRETSGIVALPAQSLTRSQAVADEGIGLSDCWLVIKRHLDLIIGLLVAVLLSTGLVVFSMTPNFTASSTLLIQPDPPRVLDIKELVDEASGDPGYDYYKTQFELLKSRDLASSVISDLDLMHTATFASDGQPGYVSGLVHTLITTVYQLLPGFSARQPQQDPKAVDPRVIDDYIHRLTIKPDIGTRLVVVSFSAPNATLAQRIVQAHVRHYIDRDLDLRNESRRSAVGFLRKELGEIKQRVQKSEAALEAYRRKNGIVSFDVRDRNALAKKRMEHLTRAMTAAQTRRIAAEAQVQLVRSGNYDSLPQVISNPVIAALEPHVQQLQAQYANLAAAFSPKYPKLAELKAQLSTARAGLRRQIKQVATAVKRQYKAAADEENRLNDEINREKARDFALNDASLHDAILAREVESSRQLYKTVLLRMQQIEVGQQAPVSNISIVERAVAPSLPSTPKKRRDLEIAGLLALVCGIALAFVFEQLDDRLKTSEEAEEYLRLPALAVAPDFTKLDGPNRWRRLLGRTRGLPYASTRASKQAATLIHHYAADGDVYRSIRNAILFSQGDPAPKTVLVTSGIQSEGKTWTSIQTALAFARSEARTLLIDADLRRSSCHEVLALDNTVGLSDVLTGQCEATEAIRFLEDRNLYLLSGGGRVTNPSELLTSARMSSLLVALSYSYDFILIDSAPVMLASDTAAIATMTDGVLLVASANTSKQDVRRATERLSLVGANVFGLVLNRADFHDTDYRRYSRYYSSYQEIEVLPTPTHSE